MMLPNAILVIILGLVSLLTPTNKLTAAEHEYFLEKNSSSSLNITLDPATGQFHRLQETDSDCSNPDPVTIVVIGSSTAEGFKVTKEQSFVGRYEAYLKGLDENNQVINLAKGGYTTYHLMPTGFNAGGDYPVPDTDRNITKALSYQPDGIIINLPSNDTYLATADDNFVKYGTDAQMSNFATMYQAAQDAGVPVWITTTQPRNQLNSGQNDVQEEVRDAVQDTYGVYALDFWSDIVEYRNGEPKIRTDLALDDGVHLTPEGHRLLFEVVKNSLVYERLTRQFSAVSDGNYESAATWDLAEVPDETARVSIADNHTVSLTANAQPAYLNIESGSTLNVGEFQLEEGCFWQIDGTLNVSEGTLTLSGEVDALPEGVTQVNNLAVNTTAGAITLSADLQVDGTLELLNGSVILNGFDLTIAQPLALIATDGSYVQTTSQGNLIYEIQESLIGEQLTFPVGDLVDYTPFSITLQSAAVANARLSMSVQSSSPAEAGTPDLLLERQWHLNQEGLSDVSYDVSYTYLDEDIIASADQSEANLQVSKYSSENGWMMGGSVDTENNILSANDIRSFSIFTGADNIEGAKPLPVELVHFKAIPNQLGQALLTWQTESETDNDYFAVERSANAEDWQSMGMVSGKGNSQVIQNYRYTDPYPLFGQSFYRLRQVDYNGEFEFSPVVHFYSEQEIPFQVKMGPNPLLTTSDLAINVTTDAPDEQVVISICDILGREIYQASMLPNATRRGVQIENRFQRGVYFVTVQQGFRQSRQKIWVK